ncbi:phage virion morphogenesis protein [Altererythrobacter indicus]|uniref:Phage virion morphogenesis protein n=1 Tax=Altericroceibacterium indicum TaxID=374177 RepID=A0A845A3G4_9SPHN|nr:phage virion morphogenesis protein [Altericroceibacterium indicum]
MDDDLSRFEEWFGQILHGLEPAQRRRGAVELGQALRRSNLKRISANIQPDGTAMEPRKPRKEYRSRLLKRNRGKMFRGLRRARNWKISADDEGVEIRPATGTVSNVASVSHFGEVATVGYLRGGSPVRTRYPERRLLGFSEGDKQLALDVAAELLDPDS